MNNTSLRDLLETRKLLVAPGAYDCLTALLVEQNGFPAVYMTGSGTSFAQYGFADIGLTTMTEMVQNAKSIVDSVSIPVIADADTGYGNALNVQRTVREYEKVGVSAIHLEDQIFPKKCGHFDDKSVIPMEEMSQKIAAAVDARSSRDFLIIARTDAITVNGYEDALTRAKAFEEAGADMVFVESPRTVTEVRDIPKSLNKPTVFNMAEGKSPFMTASELEQLGYRLMIVPSTHRIVVPAINAYLRHLAATGDFESYSEHLLPWDEWKSLVGLQRVRELELQYSPTT